MVDVRLAEERRVGSSLIRHQLNIGELITVDYPAILSCLGLGSCIALFIQDRITCVSGAAHILLPGNEQLTDALTITSNADNAIRTLLGELKEKGSSLQTLRAKVVGGANVTTSGMDTGERNRRSVMQHLVQNKIYVAASDLGGTLPRTAHFDTTSGTLQVRVSGRDKYKIL